ncbi:MAG TPA: acyl-CoA dehydrogenase C-terminal domain-containing protein [Pseudomonadales bacterium]|nr:acyl-CoA dehydrogenase C-terminal domain-containing protein [Pseudomonadales bacterium]
MPSYSAPLRDIHFVLNELLDSASHYGSLQGCEPVSPDEMLAIIDSGRQFAEEVLQPLNKSGDEQGCKFENGKVTIPAGFADAFHQYCADGWQGFGVPVAHGGQGLPGSLGMVVNEMMGAANWAWTMYPGLAHAPVTCLLHGGTPEQQAMFLPKIVSGEWAGTMCLTEAHCGSDVGLLRTKAVKQADGSYKISGTKIFISAGEHDITSNIIHAVLARVEGAPKGTKGISLFIVPKINVNADGSLGAANNVNCGSIEKKMGLKGSATCVMNFDGATGYLVGEENRGLEIMFNMMNSARLGTGLQGLALGEASFQGALKYARERLQMRSLTGKKNPDGEADPIIVHPDVRRMLMTQKAIVEGQRAFLYWCSQLVDKTHFAPTAEEKKSAEDLLGLLTPIAKAFCTETGVEVCNIGIQVFGGHGYIHEHGMEQIARDVRISTIYEGTTGIQALDLIGRKVMGSGGELLRNFTKVIHKFCEAHKDAADMAPFCAQLSDVNKQWGELTMAIGERAMKDAEEVGAASVDYTMYSGYIALAYMWAQMAQVAQAKIAAGADSDGFYAAKLATARFYFARILPRTGFHYAAALAGAETVMAIAEEKFAF